MEVRLGDRILGSQVHEWLHLICTRCNYSRWITTNRSIFNDTKAWDCGAVWCDGIMKVTGEGIAVWK